MERTREIQAERKALSESDDEISEVTGHAAAAAAAAAAEKDAQKNAQNKKDTTLDKNGVPISLIDNEVDPNEEPDGNNFVYIDQDCDGLRINQPSAEDFFWIQIEDFVEVFNRIWVVTDFTLEKRPEIKGGVKLYASKWVPGANRQ